MMSTAYAELVAPRPRIVPMPEQHRLGPGRDPGFGVPQWFATIGGQRIAFADSRTEGPALVFIHGLAANLTHWVHVAHRFTRTHRVLAVDLFGHGESDKKGGYSVNAYVEQIARLLDCLGIERATLIGHSMGGMVTTAFALAAPDRIDRAILVNPAGMQPPPLPLRAGGHLILRRPLLNRVLPRAWRWILRQVFHTDNAYTRRFIRVVDETYDPEDVYAMSQLMDELRPDILARDYTAMLPELQIPVGLIWGTHDKLVPARFLRRASKSLPNVTVDEIPHCGHMPNIEHPERVVRFIRRHLNG